MKAVLCFALAVIVVVGACRALTVCPCSEKPTIVERFVRLMAFRWTVKKIFGDEQPPVPVQSVPPVEEGIADQRIQGGPPNEGPMRTVSAQGTPQIDHGAGW